MRVRAHGRCRLKVYHASGYDKFDLDEAIALVTLNDGDHMTVDGVASIERQ